MIIQITLAAGTQQGAGSQVEVGTAMKIDTNDPRWQARLVESVACQAQEGAKRLVTQLMPLLPISESSFVPLAEVVPQISIARIDNE
jgi:hypothetical protein